MLLLLLLVGPPGSADDDDDDADLSSDARTRKHEEVASTRSTTKGSTSGSTITEVTLIAIDQTQSFSILSLQIFHNSEVEGREAVFFMEERPGAKVTQRLIGNNGVWNKFEPDR